MRAVSFSTGALYRRTNEAVMPIRFWLVAGALGLLSWVSPVLGQGSGLDSPPSSVHAEGHSSKEVDPGDPVLINEAQAIPTPSTDSPQDRDRDAKDEQREQLIHSTSASGDLKLGSNKGFGLGTAVPDPTVLFGPDRTDSVLNGNLRASNLSIPMYYAQPLGEDQSLLLELTGGDQMAGADLSYTVRPRGWGGAFTLNGWLSSARFAAFEEAITPIVLPNGKDPYLQQAGLGLEYSAPLSSSWRVVGGVNYQSYAYADELLGGSRFGRDSRRELLQTGQRAPGDVYTLDFQAIYCSFDNSQLPTRGFRSRLAFEQGLGLGSSSTAFSRATVNMTGLLPVPGFGPSEETLALNLQAGMMMGTVPGIRAFHLGGPTSVRGYQPGQMASGTSFVAVSAEYRHHLTDLSVFSHQVGLDAAAFVDYGSVLGTVRQVQGLPSSLWDKPQDGLGYGLGLHFRTDYGLFKLEAAWNHQGGSTTSFSIGERF